MDTNKAWLPTTENAPSSRETGIDNVALDLSQFLNAVTKANPSFVTGLVNHRQIVTDNCPVLTGSDKTAGFLGLLNGFLASCGSDVRIGVIYEPSRLSLTKEQQVEYNRTATVTGFVMGRISPQQSELQNKAMVSRLLNALAPNACAVVSEEVAKTAQEKIYGDTKEVSNETEVGEDHHDKSNK